MNTDRATPQRLAAKQPSGFRPLRDARWILRYAAADDKQGEELSAETLAANGFLWGWTSCPGRSSYPARTRGPALQLQRDWRKKAAAAFEPRRQRTELDRRETGHSIGFLLAAGSGGRGGTTGPAGTAFTAARAATTGLRHRIELRLLFGREEGFDGIVGGLADFLPLRSAIFARH